jgi:hypothetical protein
MREISSTRLWIGNAREARDGFELYERGVMAVVDLALEEPPASLPRDFLYIRIPLLDGGDNDQTHLAMAIESVVSLVQLNRVTLVACGMGMSRSPSIAAAAISITYSISPDEALTQISADGPHDISSTLWASVIAYLERRTPRGITIQ